MLITKEEKQFIFNRRKAIAKIATPIRAWIPYFKSRMKEVDVLLKEAEQLQNTYNEISKSNDAVEDAMHDFFNSKYEPVDVKSIFELLNEKYDGLDKVKGDFQSILNLLQPKDEKIDWPYLHKLFGYSINLSSSRLFENIKRDKEELEKQFIEHKERIEYAIETYEKGIEKNDDYSDSYKQGLELYRFFIILKNFLNKILDFLLKVENKAKEQLVYREFLWNAEMGREKKPKSEKVEVLYHATMYKTEILKNGFSKVKPEHMTGLGYLGGGSGKLISFTHDLAIAHDIARYFKEVAMIVQNKLKWETIKDWYKREKIDLPEPTRYGSLYRDSEPENLIQLIKYFNYYLTMSKIRSNPVMVEVDKRMLTQFHKVNIKDIGIIKAKVDISSDNIEYFPGEREYRVPPEAVLEVKDLGEKI